MSISQESEPSASDSPFEIKSSLRFPVVGLGASAGGIEALTTLFGAMPSDTGMAFVVILHLSPTQESHVDAILQRVTRMPVRQVTEPLPIEPNHVYVIPPNKQLSMNDGYLRLADLPPRRGRHVAIDLFFRTLAVVHQDRAVGVVLSGTGSDGAVGLQALKEHGGVAIAQSPLDAEYEDMPQSAIATGVVDMVLPVAEIPQKLIDLWGNARRIVLPDADVLAPVANEPATTGEAEASEAALRDILALLRSRTGHDFRHYKRATVLRRIERRLQVNEQPNLPAYRDFLQAHPEEAGALLQDMLISVTNFFRDREAFEALERVAAQQFFEAPQRVESLRTWVVGCASGEEAYSVAILLAEQAALAARPTDIQVFASDIDDRAIAAARTGFYSESIVVDVPPARLRQFFTREGNRYRVKKAVRESILFASHNILRDPPFSRLDLVCCRNLLIYLEREVQAHVLEMFHFAMNPGALLFLGSAESADVASQLFSVVDKKHRIYRANAVVRAARPLHVMHGTTLSPLRSPLPAPQPMSLAPAPAPRPPIEALHQRLIEQYAPPSVLVDADYNIVHLTARAGRFLRYGPGTPSHNLLTTALPEIRLELRTALFHARRAGQSVEARRIRLQRGGTDFLLNMTVRPVGDEAPGSELLLVIFDELQATLDEDKPRTASDKDPLAVELEAELQRLKEQLQGSIGDSEASTEELRASNEELQAMNEELRSATEELETSKEELQSVNEELITVNQELKLKVEETAKANDDLNNLIAATDIATLFVDSGLRIKRFTPATAKVFNIIASDVGRSLLDLTHRLDYEALADDAAQVFQSLQAMEREVRGTDDRWFLVRVLPYRTNEDRIDGAVFNFIDISARRQAEELLRKREAHMRLVAESTKDFAIITLDAQGLVTSWNKGAERIFGYTEGELLGQPAAIIFTDEDRAHGVPEDEMQRAREHGRAEDERWHRRKDGSTFYCSGVMTVLEDGPLRGFAKIARDLTQSRVRQHNREAVLNAEKGLRSQLEAANAMKDEFLAVMSHELKNPLNLILINAELLARYPEVRGVPAVARATETIRRTVRSQAKIIDDLLDLSRMNTGKLTLNLAPVEVAPLVERIVEAVRGDAEHKGIRLGLTTDADLHLHADAVRVEQIAWNLVSNALKFTPSGGTIDVRLARDGACARLDVTDSGQGISPQLAPHVFDMFQQGDALTTREHGGLGIGLALVKSLSELHGGHVDVFSAGAGQGARFSVWLPLSDIAANGDGASESASRLHGMKVLVVDDAAETLEAFRELLVIEGAQVTVAHSAEEALSLAAEMDIDLLLSDVAMPGMDGYQLIAGLRAMPRHAALPAVAVTGFGRTQDAARALVAGFDAHLSKPLSVDDLLAAVARFARRTRQA